MMTTMLRRLTLFALVSAALSACSGGSSSSLPQVAAVASPSPAVPAASAKIALSIVIPAHAAGAASARRQPLYVSAATQSVAISIDGQTPVIVNVASGSTGCALQTNGTRTCTIAVSAPVGTDTFAETLYSGTNAGGSILSQGKTTATIVAGQANVVSLALDGIVASIALTLSNPTPVTGSKSTIGLAVNAYDASGNAIIGSDPFVTPITLSDSDRSGATTLSATTLASPAAAASLTIAYSGATISQAVIGATAGSISAPTVTIAPQAPAAVGFNDYATFGYDNGRDVFNPNSTAITTGAVSNLHLAWQSTLGNGDFNSQTQPIVATKIPGHQAVLFVGGGSGNVYAYDGTTGASIWTVATGEEQYTCENSSTIYFGVGGTVAYDPASKSLYVVGNSNPSPNTTATNTLYHIDAASGAILGQVNIAPPNPAWPALDFSHTAVTLNNGIAYVGTGATCDISSWRGRVVAVSVPSMTIAKTFFTVWNGTTQPWGGGGVWGWGGVSIDGNGNVFTGVGNTDNGETEHGTIVPPYAAAPAEYSGFGEAFLELSSDLSTVENNNHPVPTAAYTGSSVDLDVEGTPAIFTPNGSHCDPVAALQSKSGALYLYDSTNIGNGPTGQFQLAAGTYSDSFLGGPGWSAATGLLYAAVPTGNGSLYPPGMIAVNPGCNGAAPSIVWHATFGPDSFASGVPRSVPAASAGGVVFIGTACSPDGNGGCTSTVPSARSRKTESTLRKPSICCSPSAPGDGALWAVDASTGNVLNNGLPLIYTSGPIRVPPTIDGNWVYVLDVNGAMYGLTIDQSYPTVAAKARALDSRVLTQWESAPH